MNRDFITLTAEEEALIEKMNEKYPEMNFDLQAVIPARWNEIRDFMRLHLDDPEAQRAAILSGGNWEGARMAYESMCDAQNWLLINYFEEHNLPYPKIPRDRHKAFINRRFEESNYTEVKAQRDGAQAEVRMLVDKVAQLVKNIEFLKTMVDDQKLGQLVEDERGREVLAKIAELVAALSPHTPAEVPQAKPARKVGPELVGLSDKEILDKMAEREEHQAEEMLEEAKEEVEDTIVLLAPFVKDRTKARRLLSDVGLHPDFGAMFDRVLKPYLDSGDMVYPRRSSMQLAKLIYPYVQFRDSVSVKSLAKYLREALDDYFAKKKSQSD